MKGLTRFFMNEQEFKSLYAKFEYTSRSFSEDKWGEALEDWIKYRDLIKMPGGLPIDRWLRNEHGYLPDFLDTKEQKFGHARIGNYEQVMIYQYTGKDVTRSGKYRDVYKDDDASHTFETIEEIQDDYSEKICSLLNKIVSVETTDGVYELEKSTDYEKFTCKQILRKMIVLTFLEKSKYDFMWVYNDNSLKNLAKIFEIDIDQKKTFLESNKDIYDKAKAFAKITEDSKKEDYIKLYDFLWYLSDSNYNTAEFTDFNNANIIFNGAPGTGKTYGVMKGIEKLHAIDSTVYKDSKYIQFHPSYTYQDFIEGIKPQGITEKGDVELKIVNGSFKQFCICVRGQNEEYWKKLKDQGREPKVENPSDFRDWPHYYFIVDEINRGNLSNIFGETFSLLEYRDYDFSGSYTTIHTNLVSTALSEVISRLKDKEELIYKKVGGNVVFGIPFNIHFIGMMNDVDRSIDAFDLALRRRFKWITKSCDYDVIKNDLKKNGYSDEDIAEYVDSCKSLNNMICNPSGEGLKLGQLYEIGHAFFLKIKDEPGQKRITESKKKDVFNNYIAGSLKEYIRQVADEKEIDNWVDRAMQSFGIA